MFGLISENLIYCGPIRKALVYQLIRNAVDQ